MSVDHLVTGSHDHRLVALSVVIAVVASYAALDLAGRVTCTRGRSRLFWLIGGAAAMGIGIWSMHYIGMLAFRAPFQVQYDWRTVVVSLVAAIFASAVALFVASRQTMGLLRAAGGSIVMGAGIAAMHYIGMASMLIEAQPHYSPWIVALSIVLAIVISFVALLLAFYFRHDMRTWGWAKIGSSVVMGAAIPVMHYTGMAAVSFAPGPMTHPVIAHAVSISSLGVAGITVVTFMVLGLVLVSSVADRRFSLQALQLESSEQRYRQIVEAALDAFVGVNADGDIVDWNAQAAAIFGWSRAEAIGKALTELVVPERFRAACQDGRRHFLATGENSALDRRIEVVALHRDGHEFPVELAISALKTSSTYRFTAFIRDITERKHGEEELKRAKDAAEAANRAKSEFLANMSHEIRTPMNGIIGMTELALGSFPSDEVRDCLGTVKTSAATLLSILNDILDFSKIESRKLELEAAPFGLREMIGSLLRPLSVAAHEKNLDLLWDIAPDVPAVIVGDSVRLGQIVTNLIGNAIKFTDRGHVRLDVRAEVNRPGCTLLHFLVSDTGIGIPEDKHASIFEPFSQADGSTTRRFGGTGLGLTISATLVRMMGGRIWVESTVGSGTTFHFTAGFDAAAEAPAGEQALKTIGAPMQAPPALAPSEETPPATRLLKILLAEDNIVNQRVAMGLLSRRGHDVTVTSNGREALAALELQSFDVVLMDVQMPELGGLEATAAIRARERQTGGHAYIVAMTAHAMSGDRERFLAAGMDGYLSKPIDANMLFAAVERERAIPRPVAAAAGSASASRVQRPDAMSEVVRLFLEHCPRRLADIRSALDRRDPKGLEQAAKALKAAAANLSLGVLFQAANTVERLGAEAKLNAAQAASRVLFAEAAHAMDALKRFDEAPADRVGSQI